MLTKEELIDELWERLTKRGTVPTLAIENKSDLADKFFRLLICGDEIDADGLADAAIKFDFDTKNAKFFGIYCVIEYLNITERNEDGEPEAWELVGYDHD